MSAEKIQVRYIFCEFRKHLDIIIVPETDCRWELEILNTRDKVPDFVRIYLKVKQAHGIYGLNFFFDRAIRTSARAIKQFLIIRLR